MDVTFRRVTIRESICYLIILYISPSSFHDLLEFFFRDSLGAFHLIGYGTVLSHNTRGDLFSPNVVDIRILFFYHVLRKLVRMSMCLLHIPACLLFTEKIYPLLSSRTIVGLSTSDISYSDIFTNFTSCSIAKSATHSSSMLLSVIMIWVFEEHVSSVIPIN